jgi:hypothetical protein
LLPFEGHVFGEEPVGLWFRRNLLLCNVLSLFVNSEIVLASPPSGVKEDQASRNDHHAHDNNERQQGARQLNE